MTHLKVLSNLDFRTLSKIFAFVIISFLAFSYGPAAERVALVIANTQYENANIGSEKIDSDDLVKSLQKSGFEVTSLENLNYKNLRLSLQSFGTNSLGADIALIYYSGLALQMDQKNYLVPTDARLAVDLDVPFETIPLEMVMHSFTGTKKLRMVLLDTNHLNPFLETMNITLPSNTVSGAPAKMDPPVGTLITYASKNMAGSGKPHFSTALMQHLKEPGLEVQHLLARMRDSVLTSSEGIQEPVVFGSLSRERIVLSGQNDPSRLADNSKSTFSPETEDSVELAFWDSIKDSMKRENFQIYLDRYPAGVFAQHANYKVGTLNSNHDTPSSKPKPELSDWTSSDADNGRNQPKMASLIASQKQSDDPEVELTKLELLKMELDQLAAKRGEEEGLSFGFEVASFEPNAKLVLELANLSSKSSNKKIQKELNRVGCNAGLVDGIWGNGSKRAVKRFKKHHATYLSPIDSPTTSLYANLLQTKRRVCPLICAKGFALTNGRCSRIAQTQPKEVAKKSANCGLCRDASSQAGSYYKVCGVDYFRKLGFGQCKKTN